MISRLSVLFAVFAAITFAVACKNNQSPNSGTPTNNRTSNQANQAMPDQFTAARKLYEKNCQNCHGANGEGGPVKLEDGTKLKVPSFREGHALRHPDSDYQKQIRKGGDGMPAFGEKLKPEEMNDLIRFIRHEFQGGMTPPAEPMKGMK